MNYVPYQLCPKCNGDGNLGRYNTPALTSAIPICDVCQGNKIIPMCIVPETIEVIAEQE